MQAGRSPDLQSINDNPSIPAHTPVSLTRDTSTDEHRQNPRRGERKSNQVCRFFNTKKGCRAQDQCPYLHVRSHNNPSQLQDGSPDPTRPLSKAEQSVGIPSLKQGNDTRRPSHRPQDRTPVPKPVSSAQQSNPRQYQISQVLRRFNPQREEAISGTILRFNLIPSDPDFPFELAALECALTVPKAYPIDGTASIRIENKDVPRGFQINVERGFDSLSSNSNRTLLQLLNDLDRYLEKFLTSEKTQTIKIVANRRSKVPPVTAEASTRPNPETAPLTASVIATSTIPTWTTAQKNDAKAKRDTEIRQLEARMGRVPLFSRSKDGITFNIPLQISKRSQLPPSLHALKDVSLIVPVLYNLDPCRVSLKGVEGRDVEAVETAFEKRVVEHKESTLMEHINYLAQNIHTMAVSMTSASSTVDEVGSTATKSESQSIEELQQINEDPQEVYDEDRPHLRFISQPPPEWTRRLVSEDETDSESSDERDTEDDSSDASDDGRSQAGGASVPTPSAHVTTEKGVLLSFPQLELHGIELLALCNISLTVKCDRCKDTRDVQNIKPTESTSTVTRTESCNKCANSISVSYRPEPMHVNSIKAGYLDLEGCTVVDMLPSHFLPTCSECSTTQPLPGIVSVRGESPTAACRECHHRMNFKIPEVKFLRVSSQDPRLHLPLRSRRKKENLGITAGTELPDRGRCKHYTKSYRWFRFSCCNRVYPCDRCHDEKEEHPQEHANRMICGWCSREQNYRPEDCSSCGRSVIRKTGGGFWEGGKGTRDQTKMNRNDPRKYKRLGNKAKTAAK